MREVDHKGIRTWIEVDKKSLEANYKVFRNLIGKDCKLMTVAKSNAYGHGFVDYAHHFENLGTDWIGIDSIVEGMKLRKNGIKTPMLVLGYTLPEVFVEAAENNISITVSNFECLESLARFESDHKPKVHIKVDTGMHRQGFFLEEMEKVLELLKRNSSIKFEGLYTHFAAAKNPAFPGDTKKQIEEFDKVIKIVQEAGFNPIKHAAATSGTIIFPESRYDMVRIGIGLMGLWSSPETRSAFEDHISLSPALSWKTIISEIKLVKKGERIGYGFTELLRRDSKIAILPVGYWHGFKWSLSSIGHVIIRGKKARVSGKVSMDMITIDITDIKDAKVGDVVTLIGSDGKSEIDVDEMALLSSSYNYEVITQLNPLMKRIYK